MTSNFLLRATTLFTITVRDKREIGRLSITRYPNMQDFGIAENGLRVFASEKHLVVYDPKTSLVYGLAAPHASKVDQRVVARNLISGAVTRLWDDPDPRKAVFNAGGRCQVVDITV